MRAFSCFPAHLVITQPLSAHALVCPPHSLQPPAPGPPQPLPAQVLRRQIKVHALGMPTVSLGDEHAANGVLQLCYLRHAFGLGEHYNSVVKLPE